MVRKRGLPEIDAELIDELPLLRGLETGLAQRLLVRAELHQCRDRDLLFREGERARRLYILLDGLVELYAGDKGRQAGVLLAWPPETFLPAAAVSAEPYLMSARTLGPARLLSLPAATLRREVARSPELARRIMLILSGQFRMAVRHIKNLKLRSGTERLAAFLLRLVAESDTPGYADLPLPKGLLASRLGLSPATLSRALATLREHGVEVRGSRVILADRARLERFCAPDPLIDGRELGLAVTAI